MGGIANAQAVVGERAVLVLIGSYINVTVIEIIVGEVPVSGATVSRTVPVVWSPFTDVLSKPIPCVRI